MSRIALALALFFGTAAAGGRYSQSISLKVTDTKLTNGLGSLNPGGEFETKLNDNLSVGGEYGYNDAPKKVFVRWSRNGRDSKLGYVARLNLKDKSTDADVTYSRGATDLEVSLSPKLTEVSLSHKLNAGGCELTLNPKWEADGNRVTLRTRLDLNKGTNAVIELDLNEVSQDRNAVLRVAHRVDAKNRVTPVLDLKSGHMSYEWERALAGDGNTLTASINPNENVELVWKDSGARGAWTTKVNVPWGNAKGSDVTFQRKLKL